MLKWYNCAYESLFVIIVIFFLIAYFKVHDILDYDPMKDVAFHVIILEHASTGKIMAIDKEQNTVVMKVGNFRDLSLREK